MMSFRYSQPKLRAKCLMMTVGLLLTAIAALAAAPKDKPVSGTLTIKQVQIAWIVSGNLGGGELMYKGKSYGFTIGGLGIGGFGASKIEATGEVFGLSKIEDFAGVYAQARYGAVASDRSVGELWLENLKGVAIRLRAKREGLALSLGADAIYVNLK